MKVKIYITLMILSLGMMHCGLDKLLLEEAPVLGDLTLNVYTVDPGDTVQATIEVESANGDELLYDWSVTGGIIIPPENHNTVMWKVPITGGGYRIEVQVSNEHEKSSSTHQNITVRSFELPQVEIVSPSHGVYFAQYSSLPVQVNASHQNGIANVRLYVNDVLQTTVEGKSNSTHYHFAVELDQPAGNVEIKAEAMGSLAVASGLDSIVVITEGVVLGK